MDKFKTALTIANRQNNLCFGVVALLTAGGEQVFSSAVFRCPCSGLNFAYGTVFLLVPALALLLLGYILNQKTWRLMTGACRSGRADASRGCRRLAAGAKVLFQITTVALVAPASWVAVALLNGTYYECLMSGSGVAALRLHLCRNRSSPAQCEEHLHRLPCAARDSPVPQADRDEVLLALRAQSQILGWLLIAFVMLSNLLLTCVARCTSPISHLQLTFWRTYAQEESDLFDSHAAKHAKQLAERNLKSFFDNALPEDIVTPSNRDWERVSALYKFSTKDQYYSTLHHCVENYQKSDDGNIKMMSIKSCGSASVPAALDFIDDGGIDI